MRRRLSLGLLCLTLAACARQADIIVTGGMVWTGLSNGAPQKGAVALANGKILAVGDSAQIAGYAGPKTQAIQVDGGLVLPGFTDGHTHFIDGGFQLASVDLRNAATPKEFIRRIKDYAKTLKPGEWITGGDWDHTLWPGQPLPHHEWIDSVTPSNPVFVNRLDGHEALANAAAMRAAAVTKAIPTPSGGEIRRGPAPPTFSNPTATRQAIKGCCSIRRRTCAAGSAAPTRRVSRSPSTRSAIAPTRFSCRSTTAWRGHTGRATDVSGSSTPSTCAHRTSPCSESSA